MNPMMPFAALFALILVSGAGQAATYRWVDEQGKVHYGDVIPPQESGLGNVELDKQGRVKKEIPRTRLSPEERRRLEADRLRAEDAKRQADIQRRRDRALLTTYVSEAEIDLTRDRALDQEISNVKGLKARMKSASEKLAYANGQLGQYASSGKTAPRAFIQMRDEAQRELAQLGKLVEQRELAMEEIKTRYEADKLRFRELKAAPSR
jgi:hypothetical protein